MTDVSFDHHSPEYARNWREINAELRDRCPVAHTDAHDGYWVVSRYADVAGVVRDDETFSSYYELPDGSHHATTIPVSPMRQVPIEMDPPEFFAYRKLLTSRFSPAEAKKWEPFVREATAHCIDSIIESGQGDLVLDIASPVPAIFTMALLGLPLDGWQAFSEVTHSLIHAAPDTPEYLTAMTNLLTILGQVTEVVAQRRAEPTDDLISYLVQAEVDGQTLPDDRLMEIITLVIFGGVDTTGSLIGNAMEWLYHHPEKRDLLRSDPDLLPKAIEEFLRYFSPVAGLARTATRSCTVGDQKIDAGERVFVSWSSANFDPEAFDDPDELVLDRFPNKHQAFGLGIHRCLGSHFARSEARIVIEEILRRMPDYVVGDAEPYPSIGVVNGFIKLPITFTPGARVGSSLPL
ncbi:cytochrome P450 [Nocardia nova]|uniref:Cytochrome P450 n=1 Tax=Nocardia nova TaxID=37330 RepID=A0A2S6AMS7_9NOCA|nr:cytochrome P450 [Nocardia nova]PPJ25808.1 cytochrome P450 [Nocardia nova]PPJ36522.1 cytochrome P450 [Nocardia nova]